VATRVEEKKPQGSDRRVDFEAKTA